MKPGLVSPGLTALFLVSSACGSDLDPGTEATTTVTATLGEGTTSAGGGPTSMTTLTTVTTTPTTGDATTAVDPTTEADPSLPETITATVTTHGDDTTGPPSDTDLMTDGPSCSEAPQNQPQDSVCTDPSGCGCASNRCFLVPMFDGRCSECLGDADCDDGGCTLPSPFQGLGAVCNDGEPGAGCETDAVCADPDHDICVEVLDVPGILTVSTCSACADNSDCPADAPNCTPIYDLQGFTGVLECVPDGSVLNGDGCSLTPDNNDQPIGNQACASGFCGAADLMGGFEIGICGACNSHLDCQVMGFSFCNPPVIIIESGDVYVFEAACDLG